MAQKQRIKVGQLSRKMSNLRRKMESQERKINNMRKSIGTLNGLVESLRDDLKRMKRKADEGEKVGA